MKLLVLFIILIILILISSVYNGMVKMRNKVLESKSGIDIYLKKRFDLIPNLVNCCKGYMKHEKDVFTEISSLRTNYDKDDNIVNGSLLNNKVNYLLAKAENYPELKANAEFLELQRELSSIEDDISRSRKIYNSSVSTFNSKIEVVPSNLVAFLFGIKKFEFFQIEDYEKENVKVEI